jgi:GNAT superfamily N-acetyltransferase
MNTSSSTSETSEPAVVVERLAHNQWHAVHDGLTVGRGDASRRPDGRLFVSIDAWHAPVFDHLAAMMVRDLPMPLYTVVDGTDVESASGWKRAGFTVGRLEQGYVVPTDPQVTGLGAVTVPAGVTIVPAGEADETLLRALDRAIRDEVATTGAWSTMPAEVAPYPERTAVTDPSKYAAAVRDGRYLGLVRATSGSRRARIGMIAVLAAQQRRGIGRALLAHALGSLHRSGITSVAVDVSESNAAAVALLEGIGGAHHAGSVLELVRV